MRRQKEDAPLFLTNSTILHFNINLILATSVELQVQVYSNMPYVIYAGILHSDRRQKWHRNSPFPIEAHLNITVNVKGVLTLQVLWLPEVPPRLT
jgi:hypothetical protein